MRTLATHSYKTCMNKSCPEHMVTTKDDELVERVFHRDVLGASNILAAGIVALNTGRLPKVFDVRARTNATDDGVAHVNGLSACAAVAIVGVGVGAGLLASWTKPNALLSWIV